MTTTKDIRTGVMRHIARAAKPAPVAQPAEDGAVALPATKDPMKISQTAKARLGRGGTAVGPQTLAVFTPAKHPPFVEDSVPSADRMAQDSDLVTTAGWGNENLIAMSANGYFNSAWAEGVAFMGFPYLAELSQRPEYRRMTERLATELTRKWIRIKASAEKEKGDRVKLVEDEFKRLRVREAFKKAAEHDGYFGGGHIYLDLGTDDAELETPITDGAGKLTRAKIGKNKLVGLVNVEPVWIYPTRYNTTNPLRSDFYRPNTWNTQGKTVHASRLLTFVGREVPDMLKPAYSFRGLSMSQMAKPYVDNWLRTRQSVSDLIESFSVSGIMTDLSSVLSGGSGDDLEARVDIFNAMRSNRGTMILDKDNEEFFNVVTPLGSLDKLQAQSQEQMSAVNGLPLVIFLGITPSGLNASSDGEIRVFNDWCHAFQEHLFAPNLRILLDAVCLNLFGEIDADIGFEFEPLGAADEQAEAQVRKTNTETAHIMIEDGIISPAEERERIAKDEGTPYHGLSAEDLPEATEEEAEGLDPDSVDTEDDEEENQPQPKAVAKDGVVPFVVAGDAEFKEGDHPRDGSGKFGSGGGGKSPAAKPAKPEAAPHPVEKMRDYDPKELDWEYEVEYLKYSKSAFPDAFSSREDFEEKLDAAPLVHLTDAQMRNLGNSMAYSAKGRGEKWVHDTFSHRRDSQRVVDALRNGKTAPPIILKSGDKLRLMAGQTRLATGLALGVQVPAKVIDVSKKQAADEAKFEESKHPRDHGKFASKAGSGGAEKGGVVKSEKHGVFATKKHLVGHMLTQGTTTKEILAETGWPAVSVPAQAAAVGMKLEKTKNASGETVYKGTPMTVEEKAHFKKLTEIAKAAKVGKAIAVEAPQVETMKMGVSVLSPTYPLSAAKMKFDQNTKGKALSTIDSAKEKIKATVQSGGDVKTATALLTPAEAEAVKNDFHGSVEKMFASSKNHFDNAASNEQKQKQAQAAAEIAKAKAEAEAKQFAESLGSPEAKEHYEALEGIMGGYAKERIKFADAKLKSAGLEGIISAPEAAQIIAYSENFYGEVNKQLRAGVMTEQQYKFAKSLNKALDRLPVHTGTTRRGTSLTAEQLAMYKPGMIVEERGFTSTSTKKGFGGNVTFEVKGSSGRNIAKLSSHAGEAEVLFKAGTRFRVTGVANNKITMEEVRFA